MSDPAWCSPDNPHSGCSVIKGVCKPMTASVLGEFQELQRQLNRVLAVKQRPPVDVDGRIGPQTVSGLASIANEIPPSVNVFGPNLLAGLTACDEISSRRAVIIPRLREIANAFGAPAQVAAPPPRSPPSVPSGGLVLNPPDKDILKTMCGDRGVVQNALCWFKSRPMWQQVALGAGGGIVLLFTATKLKKRSAKEA